MAIGTSDKDDQHYETYQVRVKKLTPGAVLLENEDADESEPQWFPRSTIYAGSDLQEKEGARGEAMIEKWVAKDRGWL